MIGYLLLLGVLGLVTDQGMKALSRLFFGWSKARARERRPKLRIAGLGKVFATRRGPVTALEGADLEIAENEFVTLVGTSGCGKSTLLSIVAGLMEPSSGVVEVDGSR